MTLLDGKVLKASDVISESVPGRKVCIISSGRDSSGLAAAAKNCDVLIHEAAYSNSKSAIASEKGHSNTELAVTAAKNFKAKRLVLSSIGNQYFPAGGNKKFAIGADVLLQEVRLIVLFTSYTANC